ncbi:hypothetical protein MMC16_006392 [Acarospora aff. strigata]|nr:hypothetical protein [Acarospora aff. strigata]
MSLSFLDLPYELREQIYFDILPTDRRIRARADFWNLENYGSIKSMIRSDPQISQEFSDILYRKCSVDLSISWDHISFLTLSEDCATLYNFDYTKLGHLSIYIDHFIFEEPATLHDLRARIIKIINIFRKLPSKLKRLDIAFIDEPPSDHRSDPFWADEDNWPHVSFRCEASEIDVAVLLEPFMALPDCAEQVTITPVQGLTDEWLSGTMELEDFAETVPLVMTRQTQYLNIEEDTRFPEAMRKKSPLKRINATSEWMWRLLPKHQRFETEQLRAERQKYRREPLYCLLDDPDWRALHSGKNGRVPATKEMIHEALLFSNGKPSIHEQTCGLSPYSMLAPYPGFPHKCSYCDQDEQGDDDDTPTRIKDFGEDHVDVFEVYGVGEPNTTGVFMASLRTVPH